MISFESKILIKNLENYLIENEHINTILVIYLVLCIA